MNRKRFSETRYSDRHIRRLKKSKSSSFFQEANGKFLDSLDEADFIDKDEKRNECLTYYSPASAEEKEILFSNAILNSSVSNIRLSNLVEFATQPLENIGIRSEKNVLGNHIYDNEHEKQNLYVDCYSNFDNLVSYLQDKSDFDDDSESEDKYEELEQEQVQTFNKNQEYSNFINDIRQWSIQYIHVLRHVVINSLLTILKKIRMFHSQKLLEACWELQDLQKYFL